MIFKGAFDELVQEVRRYQLIYIRSWEVFGKGLELVGVIVGHRGY